jgi:hypothetical protein
MLESAVLPAGVRPHGVPESEVRSIDARTQPMAFDQEGCRLDGQRIARWLKIAAREPSCASIGGRGGINARPLVVPDYFPRL